MKVVHTKNIGLKKPLEIHVDGGCSYNNVKDKHKRRMSVGIYDTNADYFQHNIALSKGGSNNIAELIAIYEGLRYAYQQRVKKVIIITDSANTIRWLKKDKIGKKCNDPKLSNDVLNRIKEIKERFKDVRIRRVPREKNVAGVKLEKFLKKHKPTI